MTKEAKEAIYLRNYLSITELEILIFIYKRRNQTTSRKDIAEFIQVSLEGGGVYIYRMSQRKLIEIVHPKIGRYPVEIRISPFGETIIEQFKKDLEAG